MKTFGTFISPKHELAETKSLNSLIKRTEGMLAAMKWFKKHKVKYTNCDHVHQFTTTDPKLAKKLMFGEYIDEV